MTVENEKTHPDTKSSWWLAKPLMSRTASQWSKLIIFYASFYLLLAVIWFLMFLIFYQTIDQRSPTLRYGDSAIGLTPGLSIRPRPPINEPFSTLIYFSSTNRDTYRHYVNDLQAFLDTYIDVKHGSDIAGKCKSLNNKFCYNLIN